MKTAIHFGAGKIGRGFIGAVLAQAGYRVYFADIDQKTLDEINRRGEYTVHTVGETCDEQKIGNISAVRSDGEEIVRLMAEADIVTTAVGIGVLKHIAPTIAKGLVARKAAGTDAPLNVIACENGVRATSALKAFVYEKLDEATIAWADAKVGFADSSVDRIVPQIQYPEMLDVAVEAFYEWNVERSALVGNPPAISGMRLTDDLPSHIERKLFTLNTGHCATAYFGNMKRYATIAEALADEKIFELAKSVMQQSGEALIRKFGFDRQKHNDYIDLILRRFRNPHLKDTVARVGRDPIRKLSAPLYFSYPISMAAGYGLPVDKLALAAAAALHFDDPTDAQCAQIRATIDEIGLKAAIKRFTGINDDGIVDAIADGYDKVRSLVGAS